MGKKILRINASARYEESISRQRTDEIIKQMSLASGDVNVTVRNVAKGLPFVGRKWVKLKSKPIEEYTSEDHSVMQLSQELIEELKTHDHYIFACPVYNFMIPASLKAWVDLVTLPGHTFQASENGPRGLLENKTATLVFSSSMTEIGSKRDHASSYLTSILNFIGVKDIHVIGGKNDIPVKKIIDQYKACTA